MDMAMETQYGDLGQWDCTIMVTWMYRNAVTRVTIAWLSWTNGRRYSTREINSRFSSRTSVPVYFNVNTACHYSYNDIREALKDHWIQKEDVSEKSADYLFLSCAATRAIVAHSMWPVLALKPAQLLLLHQNIKYENILINGTTYI